MLSIKLFADDIMLIIRGFDKKTNLFETINFFSEISFTVDVSKKKVVVYIK